MFFCRPECFLHLLDVHLCALSELLYWGRLVAVSKAPVSTEAV
jgi:hypothetical protein